MGAFLKRTVSFLFLTGLLLPMLGCAEPAPAAKPVQTLRIGVAAYRLDDTFIRSLCDTLTLYAKDEEARLGKKILLSITDGKDNQSIQNDQVDQFIEQDYDVICVNEVDRTVSGVIVDKARRADIPVIFFNREPVEEDLRMWNKAYYVGTDAMESGVLQGELILKAYGEDPSIDKNGDGKLQYVMLEGEPVHQDSVLRTEYSVKTITEGGVPMEKLSNDSANWQRSQAYSKMLYWLDDSALRTQIEVVLSNNDDMALGALDALEQRGLKSVGDQKGTLGDGPVIVGIDATKSALEAVRDGKLYGTVKNDEKGQADAILKMACALAQGGDPASAVSITDGQYVRIPHSLVTKENAEALLRALE